MAGNSKDSKILAYKDMINQLNKTISAQTELIQSLQKTLALSCFSLIRIKR